MAERLIDAEALKERIEDNCCANCDNCGGVLCSCCKVDDVFCVIEDAPTIEAKPIVYCKDCVLRGTEDCAMYYESDYFDVDEQYSWETDNDFCSWGRRAEE